MSLRRRTLLITAAVFVGLVLLLYFVSQSLLLRSFTDLERSKASQDIQRGLSALKNEISNLEMVAEDWAAWDDTYSFIETGDPKYVQSNLVEGTFAGLRLNMMMFVNTSGRVIFGQFFDLESEKEVPVPADFERHLKAVAGPGQEISGLIKLSGGALLVAARPIVPSNEIGAPRGTLIMGRFLDEALVGQLAESTHLELKLDELTPAIPVQSFTGGIYLEPIDEEHLACCALVEDIYGEPSLMMRVDMSRDIYARGRATIAYLLFGIAGVALVFGLINMRLLEKYILARLSRLSSSMSRIRKSGDLTVRLPAAGKDELSSLAGTANSMLASLQETQDRLRRSEEKFRALFEQSRDAIYITAREGEFLDANLSALALFGYSSDEVRKLNARDTYANPAEREKFKQIIEREGSVIDYEVKLRRKDGTEIDCLLSATLRRDENGNIIGYQGIIRDVTERKRLERELQNRNRQLDIQNEALRRQQEELAEKNRQIEEASEAKSRFLASISHELRTPLNAILGFSQFLTDGVPGEVNELQRQCLNDIKGSGEHLLRLANEVLDLSKIEAGKLELKLENLELGEVIKGVVKTLRPMLDAGEHALTVRLDQEIWAYADVVRVRQILLNLIGNAIKFTPSGGILSIEAVKEDGSWCRVSITDNGMGIREEDQGRIFEPFVQLAAPEGVKLEGTGLGLALTRQYVELCGGRIWFESKYGEGSRFSFTLPLAIETQRV